MAPLGLLRVIQISLHSVRTMHTELSNSAAIAPVDPGHRVAVGDPRTLPIDEFDLDEGATNRSGLLGVQLVRGNQRTALADPSEY